MKTTILFFAITFSAALNAQIFITSAHFIDVSDVVQIAIDDNPSISHTPAGPNQTWNYGELNDYGQDFIALGMADWFSGSNNFPTATMATEDENGTQIFFRKNTEAFDLMGIYGDVFETGSNAPLAFSPYQRQLTFPSTYGTTFTNVSTINITLDDIEEADSVLVTVTTHRFSEMDAWGTITTPFGTFPAIRQHIKDSTIQTATAYLFGFPVFNQSETEITHGYSFYSDAQNARYILLQYNFDPETELLSNVQWQMAAPFLNIDQANDSQNVTIYPNPANTDINLRFETAFSGEIEILDALGRSIHHQVVNNSLDFNLNVSHFTSGIYFVQLTTNGQKTTHKVHINN